MSTVSERELIPRLLMAELEEAARRASAGTRDRQAMRRAGERMDQLGEEVRQRHGILDIGVSAIRELRDA